MTLLIQDGPVPVLRMEGRTGEIKLWPAAVTALKARTPAEPRILKALKDIGFS